MMEDEMVEWHHRIDVHGFGWTPGVGAMILHNIQDSRDRIKSWLGIQSTIPFHPHH